MSQQERMNDVSETPITDAEAMPWAAIYPTLPKINGDEVVPAIVARKLERDLAQAKLALREEEKIGESFRGMIPVPDYSTYAQQVRRAQAAESALASAQAENERLARELEKKTAALEASKAWIEEDEGRTFAEVLDSHKYFVEEHGIPGWNTRFVAMVKLVSAALQPEDKH